jgi:hypothetical protein
VFTLEQQVKQDNVDYEKVSKVFTKFLKHLNEEKFGFEKVIDEKLESTIYLAKTKKGKFTIEKLSHYVDGCFYNIKIVDNSTSIHMVSIDLGDRFEQISIYGSRFKIEYCNQLYYHDANTEFDQEVWGWYHTDTFYKVWSSCKEIINEYLEIDLDLLYGES